MAEFNISSIFEDLKKSNLDPSIFETIDESDFELAPNFLEWATGPKFLNTEILPKQIEIGTKLLAEYCPKCSNEGYIDTLFDQSIGNIKDNIVFLNYGVCPKCKKTRFEYLQDKELQEHNELVGACGQRCIPKDSIIFTSRGLLDLENVNKGDVLSHGPVIKKIKSGKLKSIKLKTRYNWTLIGSKESHIVPILSNDSIKYVPISDCKAGDVVLLHSPDMWADNNNNLPFNVSGRTHALEKFQSIPNFILCSSKSVVTNYLSEFIGDWENIHYSTPYKKLAKQIRLLLLNLGILTKCEKLNGNYIIEKVNNYEVKSVNGFEYIPVEIVEIEEGSEVEMMDVQIPDTNVYTGDGFLHHNSGKSKLVALLSSYLNHGFLKIPNPLRYFGQPSGELLIGTFSALTLDQATKNLWIPFMGFIDSSPWYQQYHKFLKSEGKRLGIELFSELKTSLTYKHKHLLWHATGSQDRKMRGATRIFAAIDELGWMISDDSNKDRQNMNADAIYTALSNSLATMRMKRNKVINNDNFNVPPIIMANISSPSSAKDKIMRLHKDSLRNKKILSFHAATWEMNQDYTYETLRDEFAHMEELDFLRDFGAEPPLAANPFISEPKVVDKIATGFQVSNLITERQETKDSMGDPYKSIIAKIKSQDKTTPRMLTFDIGYKKNAFAICLMSLSPDSKPKLDFAASIYPEKGKPVNFVHVFDNFTKPIVENFNIKHAFFDRWQSIDQVHRLRDMDVDAQIHSLTYKEMDSVRGTIISQSTIIPKLEKPTSEYVKMYIDNEFSIRSNPYANLAIQLLTVRDLGHKMTKPLVGDDDIFRAYCLGIVMLQLPSIKKEYSEGPKQLNNGHRVSALGVVRSKSEGSGSGGGYMPGMNLGTVRTKRNL